MTCQQIGNLTIKTFEGEVWEGRRIVHEDGRVIHIAGMMLDDFVGKKVKVTIEVIQE